MSKTYWLPCECGEQHRVTVRQAGESIECECGVLLEVPPLGAMRELPSADPVDGRPAASDVASGRHWGLRQAGMFLGGLMLILGLLWAGYLYMHRPRRMPVEQMEPLQTWQLWQELRRGANRYPSPFEKAYDLATKQNHYWTLIALGTAGAGAVLLVGTYALVKPST